MGKCRIAVNRILMMRGRNLSGPMFQNIGGGMCAHTAGNFIGSQGGDTPPAFHAATFDPDTYECLLQRTGVGTPTSTHTADLYAPDYLGIYREFGEDEPVWSGSRKVENLLKYSEDFSNAAWVTAQLNVTGDPGSQIFTPTNTGGYIRQWVNFPSGTVSNDTFTRHTIWIDATNLTGIVKLESLYRLPTEDVGSISIDCSAITGLVALSIIVPPGTLSSTRIEFRFTIQNMGDSCTAFGSQLEDITAETLQNPELVTDGSFDTACGVNWTCGTGWSIGSGVASCDGTQTTDSSVQESYLLEPDTTYLVEYDLVSVTAGTIYPLLIGLGTGTLRGVAGHYSEVITASGGDALKALYMVARPTFIGSIDNVTVKELVEVAPGEYIPTTDAPAYKVFVNENGNTVDPITHVVTEAKGAPLPEQPWLVAQKALTNAALQSHCIDATTSLVTNEWRGNSNTGVTLNAVLSPSGLIDATQVNPTVNAGNDFVYRHDNTTIADNSSVTLKVWVKGTAGEQIYIAVNSSLNAADAQRAHTFSGDWEIVTFYEDDIGTSLKYAGFETYGRGGNPNLPTGITFYFWQGELHLNKTIEDVIDAGPIFTEGTAVSTDAVNPTYDAGNHDNLEGGYYTEIRYVGDDTDILTVDGNLMRIGDGGVGAETIPSTTFADWTNTAFPDGWIQAGTATATAYTEEGSPSGIRMTTDGAYIGISLVGVTDIGKTYILEYENSDLTQLYFQLAGPVINLTANVGVRERVVFTATSTDITLKRPGNMDATLSYFSVKEAGKTLQLTDDAGNLAEIEVQVPTGDFIEHKVGCAYGNVLEDQPELVVNGGFDTGDFTGWTDYLDPIKSVVDGEGRIENSEDLVSGVYQSFITEVGKTYTLQLTSSGENRRVRVGTSVNDASVLSLVESGDSVNTKEVFVATAAETFLTFRTQTGATGLAFVFDNISVKQVINLMDLNLNGVWAGEVTYGGSFGTGAIIQGETAREVKRVDAIYAEGKAWVDGEMT